MENVERIEPKKLLEEVRAFRLEKGMTWRKFAGLCGVSEAGLWKVAHGKVEASELTEYRIRKAIKNFDTDIPVEPSPSGNSGADENAKPSVDVFDGVAEVMNGQ